MRRVLRAITVGVENCSQRCAECSPITVPVLKLKSGKQCRTVLEKTPEESDGMKTPQQNRPNSHIPGENRMAISALSAPFVRDGN